MGYVEEMRALVGGRPLILVGAQVVIHNAAGAFLLIQRGDDGQWSLPGGAMEIGETVEETATREVREETGLVVEGLQLLDVFSGPAFFHTYPNGDQVAGVGVVYLAARATGALHPDGAEARTAAYFLLDALPDRMLPSHRQMLNRVLGRLAVLGP